MTFGECLKKLRQQKEVTQAEIGELLGVSSRMISFYESGRHFPRDAESLIKLAQYFGVSLDYLFGLSNIENYMELINSYKAYCSLPKQGKQQADEYILFLRQKYKTKQSK